MYFINNKFVAKRIVKRAAVGLYVNSQVNVIIFVRNLQVNLFCYFCKL